MRIILISGLIFALGLIGFTNNSNLIQAQGLCDFVPCDNYGACPGGNCAEVLTDSTSLIRLGSSLIFIGIIVVGVVFILRGAVKIIRSNGDEAIIQQGYQNFQGVFFGVVIIFVGIIGVILISTIFGSGNVFEQTPEVPGFVEVPLL